MARVARLSAACHRPDRLIRMGLAVAAGAGLHVLASGLCLRHPAARRAHAALARSGLSRLSGAHQRLLSNAAREVSMGAVTLATKFIESTPVPEPLVRLGTAALCGRTHRKPSRQSAVANRSFALATATLPIAEHV